MKIGLFHTSLPTYSETFILSKIGGLVKQGHDVRVFLANAATEKTDFSYVNPYPRRGLSFVVVSPFVMLYVFLSQPSVVIKFWKKERAVGKGLSACLKSIYVNAHLLQADDLDWLHFTFSTFALGRENVASAIGARMAVSFRGFDIGIYPLKHPGCFSFLWKVVDKVHTISDDLYQLALEQGLSPAVERQKIRPAILADKLQVKTDPGYIHSKCSIISIGRLEWKKGFPCALLAMQVLKQRGLAFTFKIAGAGAMEEELRFAIYDMQLEDRVELLGKLPHQEVFKFLNAADIYIQPSIQEGFCNALLEAQGSGLLCIATNAEGLTENVLDNQTGWIVPKNDHIALADKIEELIAMDEKKRKSIAQAAVVRVADEFKIDRLIQEFELFYIGNKV